MAAFPELFANEDKSSKETSLLFTTMDTELRGEHYHQNFSSFILQIEYHHKMLSLHFQNRLCSSVLEIDRFKIMRA